MKTLFTLSRFVLKSLAVFALVAAAGLVGVGVAGFVAFHELGLRPEISRSSHDSAQPVEVTPHLIAIDRLDMWQGQPVAMNVNASLAANRFIAAEPSDQPHYSYADYRPSAPAATTVAIPAPLAPTVEEAAPVIDNHSPRLTDPGSRFIVDQTTGRVVGIDGTVGAMAEARQQPPARTPEVRAALPVDASPAFGLPPGKPDLYPAVRRAVPVAEDVEDAPAPQGFNAASEIADDSRPVLRAQAVAVTPRSQPQRRFFALP